MNELILYTTEDGQTRIQLRADGATVWLTQLEIADLFQTTPQNITLHIKAIYAEGELVAEATCKHYLQVRQEGGRQVERQLNVYNLDMILAIGFRVRSHRGTQFRQWALTHLREFLIKGFALDDRRLRDAGGGNYFDELLARIRDIRSSEKLFYRKVLEMDRQARRFPAPLRTRHPEPCRVGIAPGSRRESSRRVRETPKAAAARAVTGGTSFRDLVDADQVSRTGTASAGFEPKEALNPGQDIPEAG